MTGFGAVMFVTGIIMSVMTYYSKSDARAAMAEIQAGHVLATRVRVSNITTRRFMENMAPGRSRWRVGKIASFETENGRYYNKQWIPGIRIRQDAWYKGYIIGGKLYVPELYNETESVYVGFLIVGAIFFLLCWVGGRLLCKRVGPIGDRPR